MSQQNDLRTLAKDLGISSILAEETSDALDIFRPWDSKNQAAALVPRTFASTHKFYDSTEVQPQTGFDGSTFLDGAVVDYHLTTHDVSVIDHVFMKFVVKNVHASAAVALYTPSVWFDSIELMNAQSNVLATIHDIDNLLALYMLPRNDFEQLAGGLLTDEDYAYASTSVTAGSQVELYLPLYTLFSSCRLHLPGIKGPVILRFRTKPKALIYSGTGTPNVITANVVLSGFDESYAKRNRRSAFYNGLMARFVNTPIFLPFYSFEHYTYSMSLAAGVKSEIRLSGFSGMMGALFIIVRALPLTVSTQAAFVKLDEYTVTDQSGTHFAGNYSKTHGMSKIILATQFNNVVGLHKNLYMIPFSSSVQRDFYTGTCNGFGILKGTEILNIIPASGVSGNHQIDIVGMKLSALEIRKGNLQKRN